MALSLLYTPSALIALVVMYISTQRIGPFYTLFDAPVWTKRLDRLAKLMVGTFAVEFTVHVLTVIF